MAKRRRRASTRRTKAQAPSAASSGGDRPEVDFATEYSYVLGDLKRIGILAVAMFATLVALALVIQ